MRTDGKAGMTKLIVVVSDVNFEVKEVKGLNKISRGGKGI
jgi:hypothetical protein